MLAPRFHCLGAWYLPDAGIRFDLVDSSNRRSAVLIDELEGVHRPVRCTTSMFAIGVPLASMDVAHCRQVAELLSTDAARVLRFLRLASRLMQAEDQGEVIPEDNGWWTGLLAGCDDATRQANNPEVARRAVESARSANEPRERAVAVHVLLAMGIYAEALSLWATLPDERTDPAPEVAHVQALVLALLGRSAEASAWIEVLERLAPDSEPYRRACASFWRLRGHSDRELGHILRLTPAAASRSSIDWIELARAHGATAGPHRGAEVLLDAPPSLQADATFVLQAVDYLIDGDRDDVAQQWLDVAMQCHPADGDLAVASATLALWRGQTSRAAALASDIAGNDPRALRILGATAVLEDRSSDALRWLDQFLASFPDDVEAALWRAEAYLREGACARARAELGRTIPRASPYLATQLLRLLARRWTPRYVAIASRLSDGFVNEELAAICGAAAVESGLQSAETLRRLLWGALSRLGGNRSARPTVVYASAAAGEQRLTRLHAPSARTAAAENLRRISSTNLADVIAGFDALALQYPRSPHPYTYRGELMLWLGEYRQALAAFEQAHTRRPCRWEYVGRGAAWLMLGKRLYAALLLQAGIARFGSLAGATTPAYRGEVLRRFGFHRAAERDLARAVAAKPRRVGAWMNLALVKVRLGQPAAARSIGDTLAREAPAILWESLQGEASGETLAVDEANIEKVFERALQMMRGNRSSMIHTIVTADGGLRVIPDAAEWRAHARRTLAIPRAMLEAHAYDSV